MTLSLSDWCSARRGYPVVGVGLREKYGVEYVFSDGRRLDYVAGVLRWNDPLPGTDAAHEWAAHLKMEAAPKRDACPICGNRVQKEPYFCCGTFLNDADLIVCVDDEPQ